MLLTRVDGRELLLNYVLDRADVRVQLSRVEVFTFEVARTSTAQLLQQKQNHVLNERLDQLARHVGFVHAELQETRRHLPFLLGYVRLNLVDLRGLQVLCHLLIS